LHGPGEPERIAVLDVTHYRDLLAAVRQWQPDARCIVAGDEYLALTLRCYAAAGLSDQQLTHRVLDQVDYDMRHDAAAIAVARHCAWAGMTFAEIVDVLVYLAAEVPSWIDQPDAITSLVRDAIEEAA
jgi:hypothetical protein